MMDINLEEMYPDIICPISKLIMKNPVITNNGISYEKKDILENIQSTGKLDEETEKSLKEIIENLNKG